MKHLWHILAAVMVVTILGAFGVGCIPHEDTAYELVAVNDGVGSEGVFFLLIGTSSTSLRVRYAVKNDTGVIYLREEYYSSVTIIEDGGNYAEETYFGISGSHTMVLRVILHVPEGTVTKQMKIDLQ